MTRGIIPYLMLLALLFAPLSGAVSAPLGEATTIIVTTTADDLTHNENCTIREAVMAANTDAPVDACPAGNGADTIYLPAGTYELSLSEENEYEQENEDAGYTGDLDVLASLTIQGEGTEQTIITTSLADRILDILPAEIEVSLLDVELKGSSEYYIVQEGGIIRNAGKLAMRNSGANGSHADTSVGGGIYSTGELYIVDSSISNNHPECGTGAGIYTTGVATLKNVKLLDNSFDVYCDGSEAGNVYNGGTFTCEQCVMTGGIGDPGGVISNRGSMTLMDTSVSGGATRWGFGSAIATDGELKLIRSQVVGNYQSGIAGGGTLLLEDSLIADNYLTLWRIDQSGGGIAFGGDVIINRSTIERNRSDTLGGGITGSGNWTIVDSAIISNTADNTFNSHDVKSFGGGINWRGGTLSITNSTISGNRAEEGGAGIFIQSGEVSLNNVTITNNTPIINYGVAGDTGGNGLSIASGKVMLHNTLLAGNFEQDTPDCYQFSTDPFTGEPVFSQVVSQGHNLVGVTSGCNIIPGEGDLFGPDASQPLDPLLAPLGDNGGLTLTHALLPGSPAINAGDNQNCPPADQRGVPRPQGLFCDIGAFELEQPVLSVAIDIRPGNTRNQINPNSQAFVPVAILSSPGFSAPSQVVPASLTFGRNGDEDSLVRQGKEALPACQEHDANGDGVVDLVCGFRAEATGFRLGDTTGYLKGGTIEGQLIEGSDAVEIIGPSKQKMEPPVGAATQQPQGLSPDKPAFIWLPFVKLGS